MIFDEFHSSVSDGQNGSLFDERCGFSFEESVDGGSLIGKNCSDEGLETVVGLDFFGADNFDVDVESTSGV